MEKWLDKVAVVTGASAGIGEEIVKTLAKYGLTVIGIARRDMNIGENVGKIHAKKCDISQPDQIEKTFDEIEQEFGKIDILVNNAGIIRFTGLIDCPISDIKDVIDVNVLGLALCSRRAVQSMRKSQRCGHIININSTAGKQVLPCPGLLAGMYSPSKFAVTAYSEVLRSELEDKNINSIKVTNICPGSTLTNMAVEVRKVLFKTDQIDADKITGVLKPKDVAEAVVYALSASAENQVAEITLTPMKQ